MAASTVLGPKSGSALGFGSWAREMRTLASCHFGQPCEPKSPQPRGDGVTVLVLPGFLTGDRMTVRLRAFLRRQGFDALESGLTVNWGPTTSILKHIEARIDSAVEKSCGPIALAGQSLGGTFARVLAQRHPDKISHIVTMCAPIRFPVETPLAPFVWALEPFHDKAFTALAGDVAINPKAPVTAIYSREDGIVDWRACLQEEGPDHRNVEVPGAHTTMGSNPRAQAVAAQGLARKGPALPQAANA